MRAAMVARVCLMGWSGCDDGVGEGASVLVIWARRWRALVVVWSAMVVVVMLLGEWWSYSCIGDASYTGGTCVHV